MPSSLVIRIRGRVVQSASGRAVRAQGARAAARGAAGERLAALLVEVASFGAGPLPGHVRVVARPPRPGGGRAARRGGRDARSRGRATRSRGRGPASSARHVERSSVDVEPRPGTGSTGHADRPALALRSTPLRRAVGDRAVAGVRRRKWKKNAERTAATGMPKIAPGDARDLAADEHRPEDDDRVDPDRVLHQARLEHVHHDEPADAHDDQGRDAASGLTSRATMTGGAHDTNGPKNGIAMRTPDAARRTAR